MIRSKFNIVVDGQWGSCGKGLIASYLSNKYGVDIASTNNLPNAGHTAVLSDGSKFVSKILPVSSFLKTKGQCVKSYIGPGAGFRINRLFKEMDECGLSAEDVRIHPRSMVIIDEHAKLESHGVKHIASTMQGSGAARAEKIMRGANVKLARDYPELSSMIVDDWIDEIHGLLDQSMWLHEGSQGFSLGVNHGSHYPYSTSRECTVARELSDMGFSYKQVGDVYLVIRPYPIRVGNVVENGCVVGRSGGCYKDHEEVSWSDIKEWSGYPSDYDLKELTTVTKRLRRVFTFSKEQLKKACVVNGATKIAVNFANYLDYDCFETSGDNFDDLPDKVKGFIRDVESVTGIPVTLVGTGPSVDHVWEFDRDVR